MKNRYLYLIAVFLIVLIVNLPIYSSVAFAESNPVVKAIKTNHPDPDGDINYLGGTDNKIIVEIENGAGFNDKNVFLNLRNINDEVNVRADECTEEELWRCYWNDVEVKRVSRGVWGVSVNTPDSVDDSGNEVTGELSADLTVDTEIPIVGAISTSPERPVGGGAIEFSFQVRDDSPITTSIDSSSISAASVSEKTCNSDEECVITVDNVFSGYRVENVQITVEDAAGNKRVKSVSVTIYGTGGEGTPDLFSIRGRGVRVIPSLIDKDVASQLPLRVFVSVPLKKASGADAISKSADCSEMGDYILEDHPDLMSEDSLNPYIPLMINPYADFSGESLPIKCKLILQVRDRFNVYEKSEEENIEAEIELYENALGDVTEAIAEKLESINKDIQKVDEKIGKWEKLLSTWGTLCTVSQRLGELTVVLQGIKSAAYYVFGVAWSACFEVAAAAAALAAIPCAFLGPGAPACVAAAYAAALEACQKPIEALWGMTCEGLSASQSHIIEKLIWPTGWQNPYVLGLMNKGLCMIGFHCALCQFDTVKDAVVTGVMSYTSSKTVEVSEDSLIDGDPTTEGWNQRVGFSDSSPLDEMDDESWRTFAGQWEGSRESWETSPGPDDDEDFGIWDSGSGGDSGASGSGGVSSGSGSESGGGFNVFDGSGSVVVSSSEELSSLRPITTNNEEKGLTAITGRAAGENKWYKRTVDSNWGGSKLTRLESEPGGWIFDPYKSIHYAEMCLCLPAYVYNLKKEKQIKCMYRNCIQNHMVQQISTENCDIAHRERECLYVESAQLKRYGYLGGLGDRLLQYITDNALLLGSTIAYLWYCKKYIHIPELSCGDALVTGVWKGGWKPTICGNVGSALTIFEMYNIVNSEFSYNNYDQELKGEDYCTTGNY